VASHQGPIKKDKVSSFRNTADTVVKPASIHSDDDASLPRTGRRFSARSRPVIYIRDPVVEWDIFSKQPFCGTRHSGKPSVSVFQVVSVPILPNPTNSNFTQTSGELAEGIRTTTLRNKVAANLNKIPNKNRWTIVFLAGQSGATDYTGPT